MLYKRLYIRQGLIGVNDHPSCLSRAVFFVFTGRGTPRYNCKIVAGFKHGFASRWQAPCTRLQVVALVNGLVELAENPLQ